MEYVRRDGECGPPSAASDIHSLSPLAVDSARPYILHPAWLHFLVPPPHALRLRLRLRLSHARRGAAFLLPLPLPCSPHCPCSPRCPLHFLRIASIHCMCIYLIPLPANYQLPPIDSRSYIANTNTFSAGSYRHLGQPSTHCPLTDCPSHQSTAH